MKNIQIQCIYPCKNRGLFAKFVFYLAVSPFPLGEGACICDNNLLFLFHEEDCSDT